MMLNIPNWAIFNLYFPVDDFKKKLEGKYEYNLNRFWWDYCADKQEGVWEFHEIYNYR